MKIAASLQKIRTLIYISFDAIDLNTMATVDSRFSSFGAFLPHDKPCDTLPDFSRAQSISGRNIDSSKLTALLTTNFGAGAYDVYIMQNSYRVVAPRRLSDVSDALGLSMNASKNKQGEIARCRRR